jgi:hypothetical protein
LAKYPDSKDDFSVNDPLKIKEYILRFPSEVSQVIAGLFSSQPELITRISRTLTPRGLLSIAKCLPQTEYPTLVLTAHSPSDAVVRGDDRYSLRLWKGFPKQSGSGHPDWNCCGDNGKLHIAESWVPRKDINAALAEEGIPQLNPLTSPNWNSKDKFGVPYCERFFTFAVRDDLYWQEVFNPATEDNFCLRLRRAAKYFE